MVLSLFRAIIQTVLLRFLGKRGIRLRGLADDAKVAMVVSVFSHLIFIFKALKL